MAWNLYENETYLEPLCFSNGKSQEDVVKEILDSIKGENKVIFIRGKCGTGKSAIALNLANRMGKSSIIVPGKNLQAQYKTDYEDNKYLKKSNGNKLGISVITGRKNHACKFLSDNEIPKRTKEIDSKLHDIFEGIQREREERDKKEKSADNNSIPCKIPLTEKNWQRLRDYLKQNPRVDETKFQKISDIKRVSIASTCPYWSPVLPKKYDFKLLSKAEKRTYMGLNGEEFVQYKRKSGCPYYEQFDSFIDSDVIVFNSMKYKLESALNRKPLTEVEIVDECDEFLDSLSNQKNINLDRLQNSIINAVNFGDVDKNTAKTIIEIIKNFKKDKRILKAIKNEEILPLIQTGIYDIIKIFLSDKIIEFIDQESYLMDVVETAYMFKDFMEESYVTINKNEENIIVNIITINLAKKFEELVTKNKQIVLMSGTIHSKDVLKNIFGIEDFKVIDAETKNPGSITIKRTGLEKDCKYSNFKSGNITRKDYLMALNTCLADAKPPILVHVNAFSDLPTQEEIEDYHLGELLSREEFRDMQREDKTGKLVEEFKSGGREVLFSTRDSRGIDFPGEQCNSIIFTKYPNPNVKDPFWKILMKTKPHYYWMFYKDKARRELLQKLYRGLRFDEDHLYVYSPDSRVIEFFEQSDEL